MGVSWIQETAIDRRSDFKHRQQAGTDFSDIVPKMYKCRFCGKEFQNRDARNSHEAEHPVANPLLLINGIEITSSTFLLSQQITAESVELVFVERIKVNDKSTSIADFISQLIASKHGFYTIILTGKELEKTVNIDIQIAAPKALAEIDEIFLDCFCDQCITTDSVSRFLQMTESYKSCDRYREGLVSYIHGIRAKDRTASYLSFEDFSDKLNSSLNLLKTYDTVLAVSLCHLIKFIKNDVVQHPLPFISALDRALDFFNQREASSEKIEAKKIKELPVDMVTELILNSFVPFYDEYDLERMMQVCNGINTSVLSLQDREKLNYICWRKALDEKDHEKQKVYERRLTHSTLLNV
ncbi:MAG: hypothetical protein J0665_06425 [Deltaproteobacteria bacterium]|nr:hypothetical protein [Deltaproteobacteria bacterium]